MSTFFNLLKHDPKLFPVNTNFYAVYSNQHEHQFCKALRMDSKFQSMGPSVLKQNVRDQFVQADEYQHHSRSQIPVQYGAQAEPRIKLSDLGQQLHS